MSLWKSITDFFGHKHTYRRAHKGEDQSKKYCRCGYSVAVVKRVKKEA